MEETHGFYVELNLRLLWLFKFLIYSYCMDNFLVALPNFVAQLGLLGLLVIPSGISSEVEGILRTLLSDHLIRG